MRGRMECSITDDPFPGYVSGDGVESPSLLFAGLQQEKHFTLVFMSQEHADDTRQNKHFS